MTQFRNIKPGDAFKVLDPGLTYIKCEPMDKDKNIKPSTRVLRYNAIISTQPTMAVFFEQAQEVIPQ